MADGERPLVTFALFAYNQEQYIREAVEGAFAQTYEPLEIILSDDCSTDRTFEIMQEMATEYEGPHKLILNKNHANLGISAHFNYMVSVASGEVLVAAAGDDISLPDRTSNMWSMFDKHTDASFVEMSEIIIGPKGAELRASPSKMSAGIPLTVDDLIRSRVANLSGAARAYRCASLRHFPPLSALCPTEDSPSVLRSLLMGNGYCIDVVGIKRRIHSENLSGIRSLRKMNLLSIQEQYTADIQFAAEGGRFPASQKDILLNWARESIRSRVALQKIATSKYPIFTWATSILLDPTLACRRKLGLLKRSLGISKRQQK